VPAGWELTGRGGPRPFVSWVSYRLPDETSYLWESRHQRKGFGPRRVAERQPKTKPPRSPWLRFWAPARLGWWVAVVFIVGSLLFIAGAAGSLVPHLFGGEHPMSVYAETCYFIGASLYTVSICGQLLESLNADDRIGPDRRSQAPEKFRWFAFEPHRLEFMTPFVLLIGSLVFNFETVFALGSTVEVLPELWLWESSMLGSVLFLVSACMQLAEAGHGYVRFRPRDLSWWVAVCFVLGSIGFIIGTLPGLEPPGFPTAEQGPGALTVKLGFLGGGIAFLVGSYLMLPELFTQTRAEEYPETAKPRPSGERER
jgi:hypothetical protein